MAIASTAALICDTGALLDYIIKGAPDHRRFREAIDRARTRYVPGLVLAEIDDFLRDERPAMNVFMNDLARGAFTYAPPALDQLTRAMEIDRRYGISASAWSMRRLWHLPRLSTFVASPREMSAISRRFGCATVAGSTWLFTRRPRMNSSRRGV